MFIRRQSRLSLLLGLALLTSSVALVPAAGPIRDGGIDPWNLGKGEWIYYMSDATNKLGGNVLTVTNENSLMLYFKSQGIRYFIVKAGTSDQLFNGSYNFPQFNTNLVNIAHANGLLIFGYNRSYGSNVVGEIALSDYVFHQGADGFVWDAEAEWESNRSWIGTNGPAKAWQLCSAVRSNWPTKFLAHAPMPIISYHTSFPYKEFGYWSDAVLPQIYHFSTAGLKSSPSACINWSDANWHDWQAAIAGKSTNVGGITYYWRNAIKPLAPINDVYGPASGQSHDGGIDSAVPDKDVLEFIDYLAADPQPQTVGGYQGASFWETDEHDTNQWAYIKAGTPGKFTGVVNNVVIDSPNTVAVGPWTDVRTFYVDAGGTPRFAGSGSGTDTNSFGTNYLSKVQGSGSAYVQFTPSIVTSGDYLCYQWHPYRADASTNVPHIIDYYGGSLTVYANQQTNAGNWTLLGQFGFVAGGTSRIRVTDAIPEPGAVALADGIKLVYVGPSGGPVITNQPQGASVLSGRSATFSVTAAGTPPLAYQWQFNGADLPGATSSALTINSAGVLDAGAYSVRLSNSFGTASSTGAVLVVTVAAATGDNTFNQATVPELTTNLVAIAAGAWHSLGLRQDGTVLAWGNDAEGQCSVPVTLTQALAIAAGGYHSLAIEANGTVVAWGADDDGQATVPANLTNAIGIAAGTWHSLALRANGTVVAWGDNSYGQTNQPVGLSNVVAVAAGGNHNLALRADGTVVGWGENADAEGSPTGQSAVPWGLRDVVAIGAGQYHSLAVKADGTVVAWGDNAQGQCDAPTGLTNAVAVAGGGAHSLALGAEGAVSAWGADGNGQYDLPLGLSPVVGIAAGNNHTVLLLEGVTPVPQILHPARKGSQFSMLLQTLNRKSYALERKDSLAETNWTVVCTNSGNGALRMLTDPSALAPQRFYRTRQW